MRIEQIKKLLGEGTDTAIQLRCQITEDLKEFSVGPVSRTGLTYLLRQVERIIPHIPREEFQSGALDGLAVLLLWALSEYEQYRPEEAENE
jgi:hypothetical protein